MAGLWSVLKCGLDTGSCGVLPLCGRAPVRALFSGHRGSGSMARAWVGPLYWIQWAGGCRRLHPRGRRTGPGGKLTSPGLTRRRVVGGACTERVRSVGQGRSGYAHLAENRPLLVKGINPSTTALEGAFGVFGERFGGAFASQPLCRSLSIILPSTLDLLASPGCSTRGGSGGG